MTLTPLLTLLWSALIIGCAWRQFFSKQMMKLGTEMPSGTAPTVKHNDSFVSKYGDKGAMRLWTEAGSGINLTAALNPFTSGGGANNVPDRSRATETAGAKRPVPACRLLSNWSNPFPPPPSQTRTNAGRRSNGWRGRGG